MGLKFVTTGISETGSIDWLLSGARTVPFLFRKVSGFTQYVAFTISGVSHLRAEFLL